MSQFPKWFDYKSKKYIAVEDMHDFHILNCRKIMKSNPKWLGIFNKELALRQSNFYYNDGAPNTLENRAIPFVT